MFNRQKFRFFHQHESVDCGPACLAMICSAHGVKATLRDMKHVCSVTRMGISVQDIVEGGTKIGFETTPIKISVDQLEEVPLPLILFWKQDHFVVLKEIKTKRGKRRFYVADPGYGTVNMEEEIFKREWIGNDAKGVAIVFQADEETELKVEKSPVTEASRKMLLGELKKFITRNKWKYVLAGVLLMVGLLTNWALPIVFKRVLDEGIMGKSLEIVGFLLLAQLVLFISNVVAEFISEWALTKVNFLFSIRLKEHFLQKLMRLPVSYFDTRLNTDTLERLSDQDKIKNFVTWKGLTLVLTIANIIVFSVMLAYSNWIVFLIYLLLSIVSIVWIGFFLKLRAIIEYSLFLRQSENNNLLYEFVMNMPEIKTNNAQGTVIENIIEIQHKLNRLELRSLFLNMYQVIGVGFFSKLKEIAAIALCAYLIIKGSMTIGSLLAITYILGQLNSPLQNLIGFIRDAQDARIAHNRLSDIYLEDDETIHSHDLAPEQIEHISVKNVSFKYPGSFNPFVLNDIEFTIPTKKITAIVGQSGSGKTTLMKLLLKQHNPSGGEIFLGESKLSDVNHEAWRDKCGTVIQDGNIFSGTVAFNIALSTDDVNMDRVRQAARIACIDEFINDLPMSYSTKVGNIGMQLSGGQKQRLLIARAVYRNPEYIFFDEATSSLDANNEMQIYANLNEFFLGKTVFIIAHRLSTVKNADQIIVLDKGRIIETGNHESLVRAKGLYFELVKNQLELGN